MFQVHHFITTGTSILRNALAFLKKCVSEGRSSCDFVTREEGIYIIDIITKCITSKPGDPRDIECLHETSGWSTLHDVILSILKSNPYSMSAELNAIKPWLEVEKTYVKSVKLYTTETGPGLLSGIILKRYLQDILRDDSKVSMQRIVGFDRGLWLGIASLLEKTNNDIRETIRGDPNSIIMLNATGGFKPESAYLILSGMYYADGRAFIYYIHELHREVTVIPLVLSRKLIEEGKRIILRYRKLSKRDMVRVPLWELSNAKWLLYYAYILKPLRLGDVKEDSILINDNVAKIITMI